MKTTAKEFISIIEELKSRYKNLTITDLLSEVLNKTKYEEVLRKSGEDERLDNIAELKQSIFDYETEKNEKTDSVKMMTIHTAKGLESPYVFVCGLSEGIFPSQKTNTEEKMEEERRLAYVAFTRAEDKLFLSDSEGINYDGSFRYPSRFIFNCEKVNLEYVVELPQNLLEDAEGFIIDSEQKIDNIANLKIGNRIQHDILGIGKIIDIDKEQSCYVVKFDDMETPRNLSFKMRLKRMEEK